MGAIDKLHAADVEIVKHFFLRQRRQVNQLAAGTQNQEILFWTDGSSAIEQSQQLSAGTFRPAAKRTIPVNRGAIRLEGFVLEPHLFEPRSRFLGTQHFPQRLNTQMAQSNR